MRLSIARFIFAHPNERPCGKLVAAIASEPEAFESQDRHRQREFAVRAWETSFRQ
jgi:hypothetical protein